MTRNPARLLGALIIIASAMVAAPAVTLAEEYTCRGSVGARTLDNVRVPDGATCRLEGTKVKISGTAAPLLNETFKTDAVKTGLLVGIAKITVETK